MLGNGVEVAEIFVFVLQTIETDVVARDEQDSKSPEELKQITRIVRRTGSPVGPVRLPR
jgi:hypothetical protein